MAANNPTLVRGLGLTAATSVNIANMIGTGVFLKTRVMTCNVGTPGRVIAVWVVAGLLSLAGALTYAELCAMMPRAGGEYVFIREAYGRRWGFLFGWTQFFIARTGSQAVLAVGVGAVLFARGDWAHFALADAGGSCAGVSAAARGGFAGFGAAMLGALWAYDGWNNVAPLAGEVRDPQRNLPRAFFLGMIVVGALYVFVNLAYFYVLTPTEIASVSPASSVATEVAGRFLGASAVMLIAVALMISSFGALHTSVLASARFPYAMARDRLFFKSLSHISPRTHVPVRALIAQGLWAGVLALSASYDTLTD